MISITLLSDKKNNNEKIKIKKLTLDAKIFIS